MFKRPVNPVLRFTGRLYFAPSHGHVKIPFEQYFVCWALRVSLLRWLWWPCVALLLRLIVIRIQGLRIACQYQVFEALQFLLLRINQLQQTVLVGKADIGPNGGVAGGDAGEVAKA